MPAVYTTGREERASPLLFFHKFFEKYGHDLGPAGHEVACHKARTVILEALNAGVPGRQLYLPAFRKKLDAHNRIASIILVAPAVDDLFAGYYFCYLARVYVLFGVGPGLKIKLEAWGGPSG